MNITYCAQRLRTTLDLARASTDSCARLAHEGLAQLYRARLAELSVTANSGFGVDPINRLAAER